MNPLPKLSSVLGALFTWKGFPSSSSPLPAEYAAQSGGVTSEVAGPRTKYHQWRPYVRARASSEVRTVNLITLFVC